MKCLQSSCRRLGKECKQQQEWIYSFSAPCILFSQMYGRIYREEPWSLGDVTNLAKVSKTTTTFCSCICCSHQFSPEYQSLTTSHCIPLSSLHCVSTFCCCLAGYPWLVFLYLQFPPFFFINLIIPLNISMFLVLTYLVHLF